MSREISWTPGIGDPTVVGWAITFGYFIAAITSFFAYWVQSNDNSGDVPHTVMVTRLIAPHTFWLYCTIALIILGFNKQLDFQTLFLEILRTESQSNAINPHNQTGKESFIILFFGSMVVVYLTLNIIRRKTQLEIRTALASLTILFIYIVFRASEIHQYSGAVRSGSQIAELFLLTEPFGISMIAVSAVYACLKT